MKKEFSTSWVGSNKPRKQKKYRANANTLRKHAMLSSNLSKELREKYSRRSFNLRKGDKVKIMRGANAGKSGKIEKINMDKLKVYIEGIQIQKKDGSKVNIPLDPSNLQITELNLEDKQRENSIKKQEAKK